MKLSMASILSLNVATIDLGLAPHQPFKKGEIVKRNNRLKKIKVGGQA